MKSVVTLLAVATVAFAAQKPLQPFTFQRRTFGAQPGLSGRYAPSNTGQYTPFQSAFSGRATPTGNGQYTPDSSGAYNPQAASAAQSEGQYVPDSSGSYNAQGLKVVQYGSSEGQYNADNSGSYNPVSSPYSSRYAPQSEGQYYADDSGAYFHTDGQYIHDNSGIYIHDPSGEYTHIHNPYEHQDNPYVHKGGEYVHPRNYVSIPPAGGYGAPVDLKRGNAAGLYDNRNYKIIRKIEHVGEDLYDYLYETENGIYAEEDGKLGNKGTKEEAIRAKGYFTYTGPDSIIYTVNYTADENGFIPEADHIPTPPPVPEAIARSLAYQKSIGEL